MYELVVKGGFAAAHNLRYYRGKCEALHGHNYRVEVYVRAEELGEGGMVLDFGELKALLGEVLATLDHRYLNELPPFKEQEPSSENIARFIFEELEGRLPSGVKLYKVTVWESEGAGASYLKAA